MNHRSDNRALKPSRRPVTAASVALCADVLDIVLAEEPTRKRARKAADLASFKVTLAALTADLAHRSIETCGYGWLKVPRSKQVVGCGDPILTSTFPLILNKLCWAGLLEEDKGWASRDREWRRQGSVRASERLLALFDRHALNFEDFRRARIAPDAMLEMRSEARPGDRPGRSKTELPLPTTPEVDRLRREMEAVNEIFYSAAIELLPLCIDPERSIPDPGERCAYRVFGEDLSRAGRLYGPFWLAMSKNSRTATIKLNGEPVVGLDYGQMALRTLYAWVGAPPPKGDLYAIPGLEAATREGRKVLVNALISASKPRTAWPKETKALFPKWMKVGHAVECVNAHHKAVSGEFLRGAWGEVQRAESDIIVSVVLRCAERGITALPIHDGVIVPRSGADIAEAIMVQAFKDRLKTDHVINVTRDEAEEPESIAA